MRKSLFSNSKEATDDRLVQACLDGEAHAWDALIERYEALIYSIPRRMGLPSADADDIFQNVCLLLFHHLEDLRDTNRLSGWIIQVTRRETWRFQRRKGARAEVELPEREEEWAQVAQSGQEANNAPDATVLALAEQQLVREALAALPERCRNLLHLLYLEDPPAGYAAVSERLGLPSGSIGPTRARCLQHLLKILAEQGF